MKSLQQLYQELDQLDSTHSSLSILDEEEYQNQRQNIQGQINDQENSDGVDEAIEWFNRIEQEIPAKDCQDFI